MSTLQVPATLLREVSATTIFKSLQEPAVLFVEALAFRFRIRFSNRWIIKGNLVGLYTNIELWMSKFIQVKLACAYVVSSSAKHLESHHLSSW